MIKLKIITSVIGTGMIRYLVPIPIPILLLTYRNSYRINVFLKVPYGTGNIGKS